MLRSGWIVVCATSLMKYMLAEMLTLPGGNFVAEKEGGAAEYGLVTIEIVSVPDMKFQTVRSLLKALVALVWAVVKFGERAAALQLSLTA